MNKKKILLFSDGGAEPNPGKGGFGVILKYGDYVKEFSNGYELTTNNRMELMAIIVGLGKLKVESKVDVFSDSKYVVNAINLGWVEKWRANNWFRNKKEKAINIDLWKRLLILLATHEVTFNWIKGHNGHAENERCDLLATAAINGADLLKDEGYLNSIENPLQSGKIENEGDTCRKCNALVVKIINRKRKVKAKQKYFYEYYLVCPNCETLYMVEKAKVKIDKDENSLFK